MKLITAPLSTLPGLLVLATLALAAAGCGGDDSDCVKAAKKICAAACSCGGNSGCAIGDANGAISFDNESGCVTLYSAGCSSPQATIDFDACVKALGSPACVQSTDGMALDLPPACESE